MSAAQSVSLTHFKFYLFTSRPDKANQLQHKSIHLASQVIIMHA